MQSLSQSSAAGASRCTVLEGRTILRFAHAFETGGGTERYLDDLDQALLARNAMTVIRIHLTRDATKTVPVEEAMGRGRLIRVPLQIRPETSVPAATGNEHSLRLRAKEFARDWILYNPVVWQLFGAKWTASRKLPHNPGQAIGAGAAAAAVLRESRVDVAVLHFFGGADADEVLKSMKAAGVPVALLNHYSNDQFLNLSIRKHVLDADAVAGVNGLDVPRYLRDFTNLSDGIDTDFFQRANVRPVSNAPVEPVILLPARVIREKGQMDLIKAAGTLRRSGVPCSVVFAGRVDCSGFVDELHREIRDSGLVGDVHFLGNAGLEELRDWYAASAVVAFPTYHPEGLGRVIVEAQAMQVPVVAYATCGVVEGIDTGKTGYLVPTGDIEAFTQRIRELLNSPSVRTEMGHRGRVAAEERFSLAALASRHERFYARLISDRRNPTAKPAVDAL